MYNKNILDYAKIAQSEPKSIILTIKGRSNIFLEYNNPEKFIKDPSKMANLFFKKVYLLQYYCIVAEMKALFFKSFRLIYSFLNIGSFVKGW